MSHQDYAAPVLVLEAPLRPLTTAVRMTANVQGLNERPVPFTVLQRTGGKADTAPQGT